MSIYDHVLMFADRASALAALTQIRFADGEQFGGDCNAPLSVTVPTGQYTVATEDQPSVEIRATIPGYFVAVALDYVSDALIALPNAACRIVSDRDAAIEGAPFFRYLAPDLDPALLTIASVSPVFAGSEYPFGS